MTIQQTLISLSDKIRWQQALQDVPHGPAHRWEYNFALNQTYHQDILLYEGVTEHFKAVCPIAVREKFNHKDLVTPYGFGGLVSRGKPLPNLFNEWNSLFQPLAYICGYFVFHPTFNVATDFIESDLYTIEPANTIYTIDLQFTMQALLQNMSKAHRYELRQWESQHFQIIEDKDEIQTVLVDLYTETLVRTHAKPVYHFSCETLHQILHDQHTIALGVKENSRIVAIALFPYTAHVADYFLNAATIDGRKHTRGLIWKGMEKLQQHCVPMLNLGGGIKPADSLDDFKRRFGGQTVPVSTLKQIFNQEVFDNLCAKLTPSSLAQSYFPPYYTIPE